MNIVPSRSGSGYGRLFSMSAFTIEKIAVFAPIESPNVIITATVKALLRLNCLKPKRTSCQMLASVVPVRRSTHRFLHLFHAFAIAAAIVRHCSVSTAS